MDDVLAPFIAAYQEENPGTALDARAIKRRVLVGAGGRRSRRAGALRYVLPIAATFVGSVALAASHGALPRLDAVRAWLGIDSNESGVRAPAEEPVRGKPAVSRSSAPRSRPIPRSAGSWAWATRPPTPRPST